VIVAMIVVLCHSLFSFAGSFMQIKWEWLY